MLDQVFRRARVRQRIGSNPIGDVLERYVAFLVRRGHRPSALHQYVFAVERFGMWLGRRGRGRSRQIDRRTVHQFIVGHLPACRCAKPAIRNINCVRAALNRLLEMQGNKTSVRRDDPSPVDRLLAQYENHLAGVQGLSASTTHYRLRYTRAMLDRLGVDAALSIDRRTRYEWCGSLRALAAAHAVGFMGRGIPSGDAIVKAVRTGDDPLVYSLRR